MQEYKREYIMQNNTSQEMEEMVRDLDLLGGWEQEYVLSAI